MRCAAPIFTFADIRVSGKSLPMADQQEQVGHLCTYIVASSKIHRLANLHLGQSNDELIITCHPLTPPKDEISREKVKQSSMPNVHSNGIMGLWNFRLISKKFPFRVGRKSRKRLGSGNHFLRKKEPWERNFRLTQVCCLKPSTIRKTIEFFFDGGCSFPLIQLFLCKLLLSLT